MSNYCTEAEATTYFSGRLNTDAWDTAVSGDRTKALTQATTIINQLNFLGEKTDENQDNQFPRNEDASIPSDIKNACAEIALALLDGIDPEKEFELASIQQHSFGGTKAVKNIIPEHIGAGVPSITAWRFLRPYLRDMYSIQLDRSN